MKYLHHHVAFLLRTPCLEYVDYRFMQQVNGGSLVTIATHFTVILVFTFATDLPFSKILSGKAVCLES